MMRRFLFYLLFGAMSGVQFASAGGCSPSTGLKLEWQLQSEDKIGKPGEVISTLAYQARDWLLAAVPGTVLGALVDRGVYGDLFMGDHLAQVAREPFLQPWWYRARGD